MRIGFIIPNLLGGGVQRAVLRLAGGLLGRGHQVDLILLRPTGLYRKTVPPGIQLFHVMPPFAFREVSGAPVVPSDAVRHSLAYRRLPVPLWKRLRAFHALRRHGPGKGITRIVSRWAVHVASVAAYLVWRRAFHALRQRWPEVESFNRLAILATCSAAVAAYLRKNRPDVLFAALHQANAAAVCGKALAEVETPVAVSIRNSPAHTYSGEDLTRARALYQEADAIVAVSKGVAEETAEVLGLDPDRTVAIYNPIPVPEIAAAAAEPVEHPWFADAEAPVILAVGRTVPQKDHPTLVRAFALLRRSMEARLAILGDRGIHAGESTSREMMELAASLGVAGDVARLDFDENPFRYMSRAGVVALSSRNEGLPNVLLEAMACGTPVVSTDAPYGPAEILEGGRWGPLVPVGDADALAGALAGVLAGRRVPAEDLRARAAVFSTERALDGYEELFSVLASGRPG